MTVRAFRLRTLSIASRSVVGCRSNTTQTDRSIFISRTKVPVPIRKDGELVRRSAGRGALLTGLTAVAVPTCCASAGPAVISAAASGNAMRFPIMTRPRRERLVNDRQLSADHGGAAGLDQWRGAEVELPDMRKHTDNQNETC